MSSHECRVTLAELLTASTDATRVWLRAEMDRTVDPMLHSIFNRLTTKLMGKQEIKEEFDDEQTNNELINPNLAHNVDVPNSSSTSNKSNHNLANLEVEEDQVHLYHQQHMVNTFDCIESDSIGYEPEFDPEILAQVKREIKEEESEMTLKNVMDNAQQIEDCDEYEEDTSDRVGHSVLSHQVNSRSSSTDAHHLLHNTNGDEQFVNQPISDDHQQNGQMKNATDNDTFDGSMRDEVHLNETTNDELISSNQTTNPDTSLRNASPSSNEQSKHNLTNSMNEEDQVNHDTQQLAGETNNAQIVHIGEVDDEETEIEDNEDDEESRTVEDARIKTTLPNTKGQTRKIFRQSARHLKRKQTDDVNNQEDTEEEDDQMDAESSRPVKRTRMDTTQARNAIGEETATECTTNPIQPNRHLQCSHCLKSYDHKHNLLRHLRVHTGERPFQCEQCDKRFSQLSSLTRHQLIHQNIKRFRCDQCDKLFRGRADLARHQLIHQNIKNFRCPECDKQFSQKRGLDTHLRIHSGERPFECRHCEKSFNKWENRNSHEQAIHLQVKPYRCKQCGHTATKRTDITRHIRAVHFGLPRIIKQQKALNIIDERDPRELVEKV